MGITIRFPLMMMDECSLGPPSFMIDSSSLTFQNSCTCFGQCRRSFGHPDWIVLNRTCIDWSFLVAVAILSIRLSVMLTCMILKTPVSSVRSLCTRRSCTRTPSSSSSLGSSGSFFGNIRDNVSANGISFPGTYLTVTSYLCSLRSILCSLMGAHARGLFVIASSGLWSDSTDIARPYVY